MKKKVLVVLLLICWNIMNVKAISHPDNLYLRHMGYVTGINKKTEINYYNMYKGTNTRSGVYGQSFCLAPGKTSDHGFGKHTFSRMVQPQKTGKYQAYDVAITRAYQQMVLDNVLQKNEIKKSGRIIGTIVFRWLASYYEFIDTGGAKHKVTNFSYKNRNSNSYWNQSNKYVQKAKNYFSDAIKYGNLIKNGKTTYSKLVDSGVLWNDEWIATINSLTTVSKKQVKLNITVSLKNVLRAPSKINWESFKFTPVDENKTTITSQLLSKNNTSATYNVVVENKKQSTGFDANSNIAKIKVNYADKRNPSAHIAFYVPRDGSTMQDFIVIKQYSSDYKISKKVPFNPQNSCSCEIVNNQYTGKYIINTYSKGSTTRTVIPAGDPRLASYPNCPSQCGDSIYLNCDRIVNIDGSITYYGNEDYGYGNQKVSQAEYKRQCLHICEKPNANNSNKYYCADPGNDQSGRECNEQDYYDECYCNKYKNLCEVVNPNDPICLNFDGKSYAEICPNCNASVNVPGTCNDFDNNSELGGSINDINKVKTSCNSSENNVKRCVLGRKDSTGASYEATGIISNNRYCKVYCEESYNFNVPTTRYSTSGGYFTLSSQISGTRNCYTASAKDPAKGLDPDAFMKEMTDLNSDIVEAWNEWNKWNTLMKLPAVAPLSNADETDKSYTWNFRQFNGAVAQTSAVVSKKDIVEYEKTFYNLYTTLNNNIVKYIEDYQNCAKWTNNMLFDPKISFNYDDYNYEVGNKTGVFSKVNGTETTQTSDSYCLGDIDNKYNCNQAPVNYNSSLTLSINYYSCNNNNCVIKNAVASRARWIKKSVTKSATFTPSQNFNTYHQYGTVVTGDRCKKANEAGNIDYKYCLWTRLPDTALPVELRTGRGAFRFILKFSNIGQSNQDNKTLGRLVGADNSVLNVYNNLPADKKCSINENASGPSDLRDTLTQETGYVCSYVNNCDDCDVSCEGDYCEIKKCDDCEVKCKTCIFDGQNSTFKYRTISLNNIFPNSCSKNSVDCRNEGYNWNAKNPSTNEVNKKAEVTVKEIENLADSVYEEANKQYSYTLTPIQLSAIREYNREVGSYSNTQMPYNDSFKENQVALQCDQISYNGINYSVRCISTFLNDTSEKYFTSNIPRNDTIKFKLWTETENCPNGSCLSRVDGIGPSWK